MCVSAKQPTSSFRNRLLFLLFLYFFSKCLAKSPPIILITSAQLPSVYQLGRLLSHLCDLSFLYRDAKLRCLQCLVRLIISLELLRAISKRFDLAHFSLIFSAVHSTAHPTPRYNFRGTKSENEKYSTERDIRKSKSIIILANAYLEEIDRNIWEGS